MANFDLSVESNSTCCATSAASDSGGLNMVYVIVVVVAAALLGLIIGFLVVRYRLRRKKQELDIKASVDRISRTKSRDSILEGGPLGTYKMRPTSLSVNSLNASTTVLDNMESSHPSSLSDRLSHGGGEADTPGSLRQVRQWKGRSRSGIYWQGSCNDIEAEFAGAVTPSSSSLQITPTSPSKQFSRQGSNQTTVTYLSQLSHTSERSTPVSQSLNYLPDRGIDRGRPLSLMQTYQQQKHGSPSRSGRSTPLSLPGDLQVTPPFYAKQSHKVARQHSLAAPRSKKPTVQRRVSFSNHYSDIPL